MHWLSIVFNPQAEKQVLVVLSHMEQLVVAPLAEQEVDTEPEGWPRLHIWFADILTLRMTP